MANQGPLVRVQVKPGHLMKMTRKAAREHVAANPGAFIVGERPEPAAQIDTIVNPAIQVAPPVAGDSGATVLPTKLADLERLATTLRRALEGEEEAFEELRGMLSAEDFDQVLAWQADQVEELARLDRILHGDPSKAEPIGILNAGVESTSVTPEADPNQEAALPTVAKAAAKGKAKS